MKNSQLEQLAVTALQTCLQEIPFMQVKRLEQTGSNDWKTPCFSARLKLPTGEQSLFVEAKSSGQPRLAREAVNLLWRAIAQFESAYGVFMAPYISPTSAEICAAEGIGYLDLAGNCRLCFGQVYIHKEGKPNPFSHQASCVHYMLPNQREFCEFYFVNPTKHGRYKRWLLKQMLVWGWYPT